MSINMERVAELTEIESKRLNERTKGSGDMYNRARNSLSGGVASSYQLREPWPIYLERGQGPKVWDVDGNEMWDFHNGFGSMLQGHAHPVIGEAIQERYGKGTHFAAPTEDALAVAENLSSRWGLPKWRYTNSGSESTMGTTTPSWSRSASSTTRSVTVTTWPRCPTEVAFPTPPSR